VLLGSAHIKYDHKTLVKLTPGVNFTNIYKQFLHRLMHKNFQIQTVSRDKLSKTLSFEKAAHKTMIKLNLGFHIASLG